MGKREKGGFWVGAAAVAFYPMTWLGKRTYRGAEKLPATGPVLLVMNHVSHLDPPNDAVFVHRNKRVPRFMAKDSLFRVPVFGKILAGSGGIPVYRGSSEARHSLSAAHEALRTGKAVVIYPEGTITKDPDGWPMRARTGVARLALENDVPVIPAARWGTNHIWDGYTKKFHPLPRKEVVTVLGDPVDLSAYRGQPVTNKLLREVTDLLMAEIRRMLAEIRQEPEPAGFYVPLARQSAKRGSDEVAS
ncbi:lysophospholipid acyltransferase family protein [Actinokineospora iranica]|uniref:1-acyl-sn-glycerol-3-phosphate acyltransferases n=1 Tax=Actinokineospora iranica TaxID=1271860 RepID=A0A1G6N5R2_9PSEU|nr:lysophospholipid acyltransferase family protein [Actinokineospora iranica]SDC63170.1 1-acyl-sn-glycerol-3-phosphate acyltransferases [Actinokineospora iranica]